MIEQFDVVVDGMSNSEHSISLSSTLGLSLSASTTFEDWRDLGRQFGAGLRSAAFCIGDWLNFGDRSFRKGRSEAYDAAVDETGLDRGTLQIYSHVARQIPFEERHPKLSFEHHRALASLTGEQRAEWISLVLQEPPAPKPESVILESTQESEAAPAASTQALLDAHQEPKNPGTPPRRQCRVSVRRLKASIRLATDKPRIVTPEEIMTQPAKSGHDNHIPHLTRLVTVLRKNIPEMSPAQRASLKEDVAPLLALLQGL